MFAKPLTEKKAVQKFQFKIPPWWKITKMIASLHQDLLSAECKFTDQFSPW